MLTEDICNKNMKVNTDTMHKLKVVSALKSMKYNETLNELLTFELIKLKEEGKF